MDQMLNQTNMLFVLPFGIDLLIFLYYLIIGTCILCFVFKYFGYVCVVYV